MLERVVGPPASPVVSENISLVLPQTQQWQASSGQQGRSSSQPRSGGRSTSRRRGIGSSGGAEAGGGAGSWEGREEDVDQVLSELAHLRRECSALRRQLRHAGRTSATSATFNSESPQGSAAAQLRKVSVIWLPCTIQQKARHLFI